MNKSDPQCSVCKLTFDDEIDKNNHKILAHSVAFPYECHKCGGKFATEFGLTAHFKNVCTSGLYNANTEQNTCKVCYYQHMNTRTEAVNHMKIHFVDRPYYCRQCKKTFARWNHIKKHSCTIFNNNTISPQSSSLPPSFCSSTEASPSLRVPGRLPLPSINNSWCPPPSPRVTSKPPPSPLVTSSTSAPSFSDSHSSPTSSVTGRLIPSVSHANSSPSGKIMPI